MSVNPVFVTTALTAIAAFDIRRTTKQIAELQRLQNGVLTQISTTMQRMADEMSQIKSQQGESLAIQRALLARDNLQAYLEEFIYQADKLVAACSDSESNLDAPTRFFLLRGLLDHVASEGIATPIIRGRDNKAAFDGVVAKAEATKRLLSERKQVRDAIELEQTRQATDKRNLLIVKSVGCVFGWLFLLMFLGTCCLVGAWWLR